MTEIYKSPSDHHGEKEVCDRLRNMNIEGLHAWFEINNLPGVREVDLLLAHESVGVLAVEIKAISLDAIEKLSSTAIKIKGREQGRLPHIQAKAAMFNFLDYCRPRLKGGVPWIAATGCYPKIRRADWLSAFDEDWAKAIAHRSFFKEDFESGISAFEAQLELIFCSPPAGNPNEKNELRRDLPQQLNQIINPEVIPKAPKSDYQRLRQIEERVKRKEVAQFAPGEGDRWLFWGHPGTGKTFRLLEIGLYHAFQGERVCFLCFNKTLAADIRRMVSVSDRLKNSRGSLEIYDVWELLLQYSVALGEKSEFSNSPDQWGEELYSLLAENSEGYVETYDTLLIDESQDMALWMLRFCLLMADSNASIFVASGAGQELYNSGTTGKTIRQTLTQQYRFIESQLRRNFRNSRHGYLLAQCFHEKFPHFEKLKDIDLLSKAKGRPEFERTRGSGFRLEFFNGANLPPGDDEAYEYLTKPALVESYKKCILDEYEKLDENDEPVDLLVLVPTEKSFSTDLARAALDQIALERGVSWVDLVKEPNRRSVVSATAIRLTTYHSSRGLEGLRVIVFGFEALNKNFEHMTVSEANLAFVALTRAVIETTVFVRSDWISSNNALRFLDVAAGMVTSATNEEKRISSLF